MCLAGIVDRKGPNCMILKLNDTVTLTSFFGTNESKSLILFENVSHF